MTTSYVVTPEMLSKFKEPFGRLIQGSFSETMKKLEKLIEKEKPPQLISVGDTVTRNLHLYQIIPNISITDCQSMRKKVIPQTYPEKDFVQVNNPKGTITQEAINAVRKAVQEKRQVHIGVIGEEDLLTLVAVLCAQENAFVIYGQPRKGIVIVKVTLEKKAEAQSIWKSMKSIEVKENG